MIDIYGLKKTMIKPQEDAIKYIVESLERAHVGCELRDEGSAVSVRVFGISYGGPSDTKPSASIRVYCYEESWEVNSFTYTVFQPARDAFVQSLRFVLDPDGKDEVLESALWTAFEKQYTADELREFRRGIITPRCKNALLHRSSRDCGGYYENGRCTTCGNGDGR